MFRPVIMWPGHPQAWRTHEGPMFLTKTCSMGEHGFRSAIKPMEKITEGLYDQLHATTLRPAVTPCVHLRGRSPPSCRECRLARTTWRKMGKRATRRAAPRAGTRTEAWSRTPLTIRWDTQLYVLTNRSKVRGNSSKLPGTWIGGVNRAMLHLPFHFEK